MSFDAKKLGTRAAELARHSRTKKIAIWFVAIIVAVGVLGALVAPLLLRHVLSSQLTAKLHRQVTIEQIRINPYTMTAAIRGFLMKERQSSATAVSFDELFLNLQLQSLFRLAPVIKELRLVKPHINLVRNDDRTYNYQDLINEFTSGPSGPTPRFALNNIEIIDGKIDFDDRPEKTKHTISSIRIGVPFISSLPSYTDIKVKPAFSALVNGAPFVIGGETEPFKDSRDSTIRLDIQKLAIPKYIEYSPLGLNFTVPSGQIDGKLTVSFKGKPSLLSISGTLGVHDLMMKEKGDAPLMSLPSVEINIDAFEALANRASFKTIAIKGPELTLRRGRDGQFNLSNLIITPPTKADVQPAKPAAAFVYHIDGLLLEAGKLHFIDETLERPYRSDLSNVLVKIQSLTNEAEKKATLEIAFDSEAKEHVQHSSVVQLTPLAVDGTVEIKNLQLKGLRPYYESVLGVEIADGALDLDGHIIVAQNKDGQTETKFGQLNAALRSLRLEVPGESDPLWRAPLLAIKDTTVDIEKKSIVIGSVESHDGIGYIRREKDGTINFARIVKTTPGEKQPPKAQQQDTAEWTVETKRGTLDRFRIDFEDRTLNPASRFTVSALSARLENASNVKNSRANVRIQATINNKGNVLLAGTLGTRPVAGRFNLELQRIGLIPFQPYVADQINFTMASGDLSSKGLLTVDLAGDGPAKIAYEGNMGIADFASVEKNVSQDLLKWKALDLGGIQFNLEPLQLRIGEISLNEFYSRLILGADGKLNLQNLAAQKPAPGDGVAAKPVQPAPAPAASSAEKAISIGKISLQNGNINFSDFFIKPNYSANLTSVQGTISELKPEMPGDVAIDAKLDNSAPVDIRGKINPLSKDLYMDLVADAKEIDLTPMSPYSGKYVGYGIEKGKLSFNVKYKLDNRKLSADNKIILNQLTFGEKVESPDATKLPVLLAVALLKDRNGVIDIDLPIGGSLDDPQFSVGGIILKLILNIITKAVTAPFALLGSIFGGGGGEELSYVEFDYGRAALNQTAEAKVKSLATAMNNRPALRLEISGHVDPVNDLEGLKKAAVERKIKAQKLRELVRQGAEAKSLDDIQLDAGEYERYLKAAYGQESFPKPRNVIGLAKDLPAAEMEGLMLKNTQVSDDDVRDLANRRARAVRDGIMSSGQVTADRLFIVAAKSSAADEKEKLKASRVDFALK
jgi:uncharacterized protein involved in outer membrane biogenesis